MSRQRACLDYLTRYQRASGGISPTLRQIRDAIGIKGMSSTIAVLDELEARGEIRRWHGSHRRIQVLKPYTAYDDGNAEFWVWDRGINALVPRPRR